jgi:superfamily II DNA or RNA helicase
MAVAAHTLPLFDRAPMIRDQAPVVISAPQVLRPNVGELRPYQRERIAQARELLVGNRSVLIVMATGTGKTRVFGEIAAEWPGRVLVLAHRRELIAQAHARIRELTGELVGIERADQSSHGERIVVASKDTLHPERLRETFRPDAFGLVIIDEAHHAVAKTYTAITDYLAKAKLVGVTATPDRQDEAALGRLFEAVCEPYDILDGINDGFLCPIVGRLERLPDFDLKGLRANGPGGDYSDNQLGAELLHNDATLKAICTKTLEHAGERKSILFFPTVETAHLAAETFNTLKPGSARAVDGTTPDDERDRTVRAFRDRDLQILTNCGVFTEGADFPLTSLVGIARPTKSRALYAQMVGRGTRIAPGKSDCIVLDFIGASDVLGLMCPEDLLGGRYDDDVIEEAKKRKEGAAHERLEAAQLAVASRKKEAARIAAAKAARTTSGSFDPFRALGVREPSAAAARYAAPLSEKQTAMLLRAGFQDPSKLSRQQASAVIGKLMDRRDKGLATLPQVRVFSKRGIDAKNASFANARQAMDFLASNNWRASNADVEAILFRQRQPGEDA